MARSVQHYMHSPTDLNYAYSLLLNPTFRVLDNVVPHHPPSLFKAGKKNVDPDLPDLQTALTGPNREGFLEAMRNEISQLENLDAWDVVPVLSLSKDANILPGTWAFRIK